MGFRAKRNHMPVRDELHTWPWGPAERVFTQERASPQRRGRRGFLRADISRSANQVSPSRIKPKRPVVSLMGTPFAWPSTSQARVSHGTV